MRSGIKPRQVVSRSPSQAKRIAIVIVPSVLVARKAHLLMLIDEAISGVVSSPAHLTPLSTKLQLLDLIGHSCKCSSHASIRSDLMHTSRRRGGCSSTRNGTPSRWLLLFRRSEALEHLFTLSWLQFVHDMASRSCVEHLLLLVGKAIIEHLHNCLVKKTMLWASAQQRVEPLPGHVIRLVRVHSERMDLIPKASGPGRWIVFLEELSLKILPRGDRIVMEGIKPSRSTTREREWEEKQVDSVLRHTRDIEGITYAREAGQVSGCILILEAMKFSGMSDRAHDM
ncbi:hypothetical protein L1987_15774 [Smallanthus sonchifolius]|uniref:Uncharacterized protein n=1 Tax=Smallanthus sonchifolius TaxID=185202 RepID=A0ACB9J8M2_9ASTR|nr:hypothetical protein L1987_15774 [Smallanthus sonchifolius]